MFLPLSEVEIVWIRIRDVDIERDVTESRRILQQKVVELTGVLNVHGVKI